MGGLFFLYNAHGVTFIMKNLGVVGLGGGLKCQLWGGTHVR